MLQIVHVAQLMWLAHTDFYYYCIYALPPPPFFLQGSCKLLSLLSSGACVKKQAKGKAVLMCTISGLEYHLGPRYFIIGTCHNRQHYEKFPKLVCAAVGPLHVG